MIERIAEELYVDAGNRRFHRVPGEPNKLLVEAGKYFSFELCRKQTSIGDVPVDQFWLELHSVYGDQNRRARNYDLIVEFFWELCWKDNTVLKDAVQDSYILAKLLPYTRSTGSRRVFNDAVLTKPKRFNENRQDILLELDAQLSQYRQQEFDPVEFRDNTAKFLGPPDYDDEVQRTYRQMSDDLLGEGREALQRDGTPGLQVPLQRWDTWMNSIGRHRGHEHEKQVLNILSCECRAALNRCYSATWWELLLHLAKKYAMSRESGNFHQLWHLDFSSRPDSSGQRFHLFHGHVFALHPGAGAFISTTTGASLIGDCIKKPSDGPTFRRFLNGMMIALNHYAVRHGTYAELRRKGSGFVSDGLESIPAEQLKRTGRRRERHLPRDE